MTMEEFSENMQKYGVGSFSNIYIKQKLIAKYTDSVNFIEKTGRGRSSIIILDMMKHVIIDEWYTNRLENCHEESIRIIKMAAKLLKVKSSIKKHEDSKEFYPSVEDIKYEP